ncbi:MAG: endo-1,4-beta-xylanase [Phycisphaerales bacterium]|nr:endo-1,4-beta-xylanase [Phycisphaerales bacterium]
MNRPVRAGLGSKSVFHGLGHTVDHSVMLRIKVYENGAPAKIVDLSGAYLVGNDRVPMRAELKFANGEIVFDSRSRGAAALSIMWPVDGVGRIMLDTPRLQERKQPYDLNVELARGRLMQISQKREDWGLYGFLEGEPIYADIDKARGLLLDAMTASDEATAARLGAEATAAGVRAGEAVSAFHAEVFLKRRLAANQIVKRPLGCRVDPEQNTEAYVRRLTETFDFAVLPFHWSSMEPKEGTHKPTNIDPWLKLLRQRKTPAWGASLLSLSPTHLPDWLQRWANNYEHFRDCVTKHIKHVLKTYGSYVQAWEVISGVHAHNDFRFTFEQIMELTRISALLVKQMAPKSTAIIGIALPWGEYYATDPRTIPPTMYAEMAVQSGINFDAFGLEICFGSGERGHYARDMMQISALLDRFGNLGKPLHITAAGVPSGGGDASNGSWHGEWSAQVQAEWVRQFYRVAFSKPFVETVTCVRLADGAEKDGLVTTDCSPKAAYQEILRFKREIIGA